MLVPADPCTTSESALLASDLHLDGGARGSTGLVRLLRAARQADADLYLLGDVFDYWFGPKQVDGSVYRRELRTLREAVEAGTRVYFLPGNRDFLIDNGFAQATGVRVLSEGVRSSIAGEQVYLTHGDMFSTRDFRYQRMKRVLRSRMILFLARHLPGLLVDAAARALRNHSERVVRKKRASSLEPDLDRVREVLGQGIATVVCGHFHSGRREELVLDGRTGRFIVLEPFDVGGHCLRRDVRGWTHFWLSRTGMSYED